MSDGAPMPEPSPSTATDWRWLRLRGYLGQWLTPHQFEIAMDCLDKAEGQREVKRQDPAPATNRDGTGFAFSQERFTGLKAEHFSTVVLRVRQGVEVSGAMSEQPKRIQRKRSKGWRMPPNTVYVGRPSKWGNPWTAEKYWDAGFGGSIEVATKCCVEAYRAWLLSRKHWAHGALAPIPDLTELRGKDLACWCPLNKPCHADVLLEIANAPEKSQFMA